MTKTKLKSHQIDICVGKNLKLFRQMRRMSQMELANQLGITFQQIQKYEKGANRLSASRMFIIANTLKINVSDFYQGLENDKAPSNTDILHSASKEEVRLIALFRKIESTAARKSLLSLLEKCN